MSDQIFNQIADGQVRLHDALRAAFLPTGSRCFLLKAAVDSGTRYTALAELTNGWFVEFSEYRGQWKLLYATLFNSFADKIAQTSFIAYGVPDLNNELEVFGIDPERRDVIAPTGTNPVWKVYVDKAPSRRFVIPNAVIPGVDMFITNEIPNGLINGVNKTFTLLHSPIPGSVAIHRNGVQLYPGLDSDYTIDGGTFTMKSAPAAGNRITVNYYVS